MPKNGHGRHYCEKAIAVIENENRYKKSRPERLLRITFWLVVFSVAGEVTLPSAGTKGNIFKALLS